MRYQDNETQAVEARICQLGGYDERRAEYVFERVWKLARDQQRLGNGRAKEIYISMLAAALERLHRDRGDASSGLILLGAS